MIIANPIYDVIFKYLLEDKDIAREILSTILGEEIVNLEMKPQETAIEGVGSGVNILRFDFKAIIRTSNGELEKVLIELQKAKQAFDVMRFRRYLGENYRKEDDIVNENGESEKNPLPIITIYFLGFSLENIQNAVVKINREYRDGITQEIIEVKEDFVELLTHDTYLIQTRKLTGQTRTKLERILQVFSPLYRTKDPHQLDFKGHIDDPLVKKMTDRLGRAIASEVFRDKMDVEDEINRVFEREIQKLSSEKDAIILTERRKAEQERRKAEKEKQKNKELLRQLEELKKQIKK